MLRTDWNKAAEDALKSNQEEEEQAPADVEQASVWDPDGQTPSSKKKGLIENQNSYCAGPATPTYHVHADDVKCPHQDENPLAQ